MLSAPPEEVEEMGLTSVKEIMSHAIYVTLIRDHNQSSEQIAHIQTGFIQKACALVSLNDG